MALKKPNTARPDHAGLQAGNQGDVMKQEPVSGKSVIRRGAAENEADIDIGTSNNPRDLDGGANDFDSGARNAGGAEALVMQVTSDDNANFNIHVDWLDDDENVVITTSKSALQGTNDVELASLKMRSDRYKVRVEDASGGQNRIHGSINAH